MARRKATSRKLRGARGGGRPLDEIDLEDPIEIERIRPTSKSQGLIVIHPPGVDMKIAISLPIHKERIQR